MICKPELMLYSKDVVVAYFEELSHHFSERIRKMKINLEFRNPDLMNGSRGTNHSTAILENIV
jgi:hypothetical protein